MGSSVSPLLSGIHSAGLVNPYRLSFKQLGDFYPVPVLDQLYLSWYDLFEHEYEDTVGAYDVANPTRVTIPQGFRYLRINCQVMISTVGAVLPAGARWTVNVTRDSGLTDSLPLRFQTIPAGLIETISITSGIIVSTPGEYFRIQVQNESSNQPLLIQGDECFLDVEFFK